MESMLDKFSMNGDSKRISYETNYLFRSGTKGNFNSIKQCNAYAKRRFLCVSVFDSVVMFVNPCFLMQVRGKKAMHFTLHIPDCQSIIQTICWVINMNSSIIKWVLITPQCQPENLSSNPNSKIDVDKHRIFWFENQPLPLPLCIVVLVVLFSI